MAVSYVELISSREFDTDQITGRWTGVRRFQSPVADLDTNLALIAAISWTINGLALTPSGLRVNPDDPLVPKTATISAHYSLPSNPRNFVVGKGYLSARVETTQARAKLKAGVSGTPVSTDYIEGETDANQLLGIRWKVVRGSNIVPVRRVIVQIATAYALSAFDWSTHISSYFSTDGRPKKNSDSCANIFGAAAGELLMLGAEIPKAFLVASGNDRVPVVYTMLFQKGGVELSPTGEALAVAQFQRSPANKYVMHQTDNPPTTRYWLAKDGSALAGTNAGPTVTTNARTRTVTTDKIISAAAARTLYEEVAYSDLNSLVSWGA